MMSEIGRHRPAARCNPAGPASRSQRTGTDIGPVADEFPERLGRHVAEDVAFVEAGAAEQARVDLAFAHALGVGQVDGAGVDLALDWMNLSLIA
jgi:hypothetical protein